MHVPTYLLALHVHEPLFTTPQTSAADIWKFIADELEWLYAPCFNSISKHFLNPTKFLLLKQ